MVPAERAQYATAVRTIYRAIGGSEERQPALDALEKIHIDGVSDLELMMRKRLILWYTQLDAVDEAACLLRVIVDDMNEKGLGLSNWSFLWLQELQPLHRHNDFVDIARDIGMVQYWQTHGPPDGYLFDGERLVPRHA